MNVLVTGVSKGLGLATTKLLLAEGYTVFGVSRTLNEEVELLLNQYGDYFKWKSADLASLDPNVYKTLFSPDFISNRVPLNGFVNNAAMAYDDIVTNIDLKKLEEMYRVNVFMPMVIVKYAIRNMLFNKIQGSIVHLSSISVHTGYKGLSMYASTKGALEAFSKNTAREWGERGVRSNCIVAGFMETEMSSTLTDDQRNRIYSRTSLKKATSLHSVASTISFLLSDASASITGQNIFVDSGTI